jgi:hypothetical protein
MENVSNKIVQNIISGSKKELLKGEYKKGKKLMEEEFEEEDESEDE